MRKMLVACLGTRSARSSDRRLLSRRCQDRKKSVRGQMGKVAQCSSEYTEQNSMATSDSFWQIKLKLYIIYISTIWKHEIRDLLLYSTWV